MELLRLVVERARRRRLPRGGTLRASPVALLSCVVVGCLLPGANAVLFYAEEDVPSGLASLIIASVPLWVVLLRLGLRELSS